jgi:protein SCO1/2
MSKRIFYQLGIGLILGFLMVFIGTQFFIQPYTYQGSLIDPPVSAPDFTLFVSDGTDFTLNDFRGRIVLLYFGYTFCPDVCPTTLYDITRVKDALGDQASDIIVAMITVDPKRDSLDILGEYVTTFDPAFYGLSGDTGSLKSVWADYGVYRGEVPVEGSAGYLVDHTARVYTIDQDGNLRMTFPFGMSWEAMADDIRHLLEE